MISKNSECDFKDIITSLQNGIIIINQLAKIIVFNDMAENLTGYKRECVIGKRLTDVLPDSRGMEEVLKTGLPQINVIVKTNQKTVISNRTPIVKNGKIIGVAALFQELSSLSSIFEKIKDLQDINAEMNCVINSSYDGIVVVDREGLITRVSSSYERLTGLKVNELLGKNVKKLENEGILSQSLSLQVFQKKKCVSIHQEFKTGKKILITGTPIFDEDGQVNKVVINARDLTELEGIKFELDKSLRDMQRSKYELNAIRLKRYDDIPGIIFQSFYMMKVIDYANRAALVDATVFITGESGVGKGEIAKYIHNASKRKDGPFIDINCGAIPENLLESELFGYEKGAFTGADQRKIGLFELANKGTLFLDEVATLPVRLQVKLLKVLQENKLFRLGGLKTIHVDVRILAATNHDIDKCVKSGEFREDLFYRLNVLPLYIPPLRERKEDIIPLVNYFLELYNKKYMVFKTITYEAKHIMENYCWHGNVRELKNCMERLIILTEDEKIDISFLPNHIVNYAKENSYMKSQLETIEIDSLKEAKQELEKQLIQKAINKYKSTRKAAEVLGVDHSTVVRKLKKYKTT